ncbi:hypothetical protein Agub_g8251, partial [Astrephomene gubernaculifera]
MSRFSAALQVIASAGVSQLSVAQWAPLVSLGALGQLEQRCGRSMLTSVFGGVNHQPAGARHITSSTGSQQEGQSTSSSGSASDKAPASTSLKDLLQVSSARIAQGDVSRLADVNADLAAAAAAARLEASLQPSTTATTSTEQQPTSSDASAEVNPDEAASTSGPSSSTQQQQQQRLLHPKYGYGALGGVLPAGAADEAGAGVAGLVGALTAQHPRVNPRKMFMPGETYEPQDLNPYAVKAQQPSARRGAAAIPRPSVSEVLEKADYKNVAFLARWFLSPAGRLLSRRQTKLPVAVHKYVSRQVKLARHMGLMAGESRLDKMHLPRLREQELIEAQQRAAYEGA